MNVKGTQQTLFELLGREPDVSVLPFYESRCGTVRLFEGNCLDLFDDLRLLGVVDLVFADPPYFLSNGGFTVKGGRRVSVHKGTWDRLESISDMDRFNRRWLARCQEAMAANAGLWVSGTRHNIFSIGSALQALGFKILNDVVWEKPNPPPNLSCRYFTHATETLLWAARDRNARHTFCYEDMKADNGGTQMRSVWHGIAPPRKQERARGKHPTQKPLALLRRILCASSTQGDLVLDPFLGSGTTAVACAELGRRCIGIEMDEIHLALSVARVRDALGE